MFHKTITFLWLMMYQNIIQTNNQKRDEKKVFSQEKSIYQMEEDSGDNPDYWWGSKYIKLKRKSFNIAVWNLNSVWLKKNSTLLLMYLIEMRSLVLIFLKTEKRLIGYLINFKTSMCFILQVNIRKWRIEICF